MRATLLPTSSGSHPPSLARLFPARFCVQLSGSSLLCHQVQQWQVPSLPAKDLVALSHRLRTRATRSFPFSSFRSTVQKMGLFVMIGINSCKGCSLCHVGHFRKPVKHSTMQSEGPSLSRSLHACMLVPCLFFCSLCPPSFLFLNAHSPSQVPGTVLSTGHRRMK